MNTEPFRKAVEKLSARTPLGSKLRTASWDMVDDWIRQRVFFSAGIEDVKLLEKLKSKLEEVLAVDVPDRAFMDRTKFVKEMRQVLGVPKGVDSTSLTDIYSSRRLQLIYNFHVTDSYEYGRWKMGQDEDILDEFPCRELIRVESRIEPRVWQSRWTEAGGTLYSGRMIARKDDPVWRAISRFGRPWPPFDFGSGMGVQDVDREEAEGLGVITADESISPANPSFNDSLEASAASLGETAKRWLSRLLKDKYQLEGDKIVHVEG